MNTYEDLNRLVQEQHIQELDLRFVDLFGSWHHITIPAGRLNERLLTHGVPFDGSSIPGFSRVEGGDLVLIPDVSTALLDSFWDQPTLGIICSIAEADTKEPFGHDPRTVAHRAEALLRAEGIADQSLWGPEFEFYIFDKVVYRSDINISYYRIDSNEADWNTDAAEGHNLGYKIPRHGGYHAMPPLDKLYNLRAEMSRQIEEARIPVRYHHHEVGGPGQSEIEIEMLPLEAAADATMIIKYITRMVARNAGKAVTYMPKPLYNEAGSGMHFHQLLVRDNKSLFYDKDEYAGLSRLALQYIGGILRHGRALTAFTNPSTNSFKRLVPGFEAPVTLCYGLANRSAAIRIPKYVDNEQEKRMEYRPPDGTANVYLTMAAQLMAGIDGILNHIDPREEGFGPVEGNIFNLPEEEQRRLVKLPTSLKEALEALEQDHQFLLRGDVFTESMIKTWIDTKMRIDYEEVRNRPHPYEMSLYFDM